MNQTKKPTGQPKAEAVTIPFDACICDGKVAKPRNNCWATTHNLKVAK